MRAQWQSGVDGLRRHCTQISKSSPNIALEVFQKDQKHQEEIVDVAKPDTLMRAKAPFATSSCEVGFRGRFIISELHPREGL